MTEDDLKKWFAEIAVAVPKKDLIDPYGGLIPAANRFIAEAESALRSAFPGEHPLCRQWDAALKHSREATQEYFIYAAFGLLGGVFESAHAQLEARRRGTFTSIVRSAAENDLLGVAEELLDNRFPTAAAAVTAGGTLEVHLRGLCERQGVKWDGKDQIENYKAALEREHKADATKGITTTDAKLVNGWGGLRNDAAHRPDEFSKARSVDDVRATITQIREFIARTT